MGILFDELNFLSLPVFWPFDEEMIYLYNNGAEFNHAKEDNNQDVPQKYLKGCKFKNLEDNKMW